MGREHKSRGNPERMFCLMPQVAGVWDQVGNECVGVSGRAEESSAGGHESGREAGKFLKVSVHAYGGLEDPCELESAQKASLKGNKDE